MENDKKPFKMKFDNSVRVSYPKDTYLRARSLSLKLGVSLQDLQRMAMDKLLNESESK